MPPINAAADSHVGRRRKKNEDCFAALPELGLFMVADGLGGKAGGEIASRMAVEIVQSCMAEDEPEDTWPYGLDSMADRDEARFLLSLRSANRRIFEASRRNPEARGMGTTFAGVLVTSGSAYIAHVGDSRVYRFREGHLQRLTRDHSLVQELARLQGPWLAEIGTLEADMASIITRALGTHETVAIEMRVEPLRSGDTFLLCSDGLWGPVSEQEMEAILSGQADLGAATAALIDRANHNGGPDNVTCVLARVEGPLGGPERGPERGPEQVR